MIPVSSAVAAKLPIVKLIRPETYMPAVAIGSGAMGGAMADTISGDRTPYSLETGAAGGFAGTFAIPHVQKLLNLTKPKHKVVAGLLTPLLTGTAAAAGNKGIQSLLKQSSMSKKALNELDPTTYGLSGAAGGAASAGLGRLADLYDFKKHTKEIKGLLDYMDNVKADNPKMSEEAIYDMAPGKSKWLEDGLRGTSRAHVKEFLDRTTRHKPTLSLGRFGRNAGLAGGGALLTALGVNKLKGALDDVVNSVTPANKGYLGASMAQTHRDTPLDTLKGLLS